MKVAIMGAGLAGLSCAITLEKHGIYPTIFEKRDRVGDRFVNGEGMFNIFNKPVNSCLTYLSDKYEIHLKPLSEVNIITFHSKNKVATLKNSFGLTNIRGRHPDSFEEQLLRQVESKINFDSQYEYEDLKKEFDFVVLATGDGDYAKRLGNYRCDLTVSLKGATVEGCFKPDHLHIWFSEDFAPKGYAYIIPYNEREANIVIAYPDSAENRLRDRDRMWTQFFNQVREDMKQELRVTDRFEITKYVMGICHKPRIEGTYFTGNCFGTLAPAYGFGQFTSILTGIYAAYDICGIESYEKLVEPLFDNYRNSLVLRDTIDNCGDRSKDYVIGLLNYRLLNSIVSRVCGSQSKFDGLKWLSYILRAWNSVYRIDRHN